MVYQRKRGKSGAALREAMIGAAFRVVEQKGADAINAVAICRKFGVSQTASYAHFPDGVTELLGAVAIRGFDRLRGALDKSSSATGAEDSPRRVFLDYVRFGLEFPNLYRAMFSPRLAPKLAAVNVAARDSLKRDRTYRELLMVKAMAYEAFVSPMQALRRASVTGSSNPGDAEKAVATLAHGLVLEFIDEGIDLGTTTEDSRLTDRLAMASRLLEMVLYGVLRDRAGPAAQRRPDER